MEYAHLSSTVQIKTVSENGTRGVFEVEGLFAGYGLTIGNALRRTLLSSLPGTAVTQIKVKNVAHEFQTLPGLLEDIVAFSLNFKKLRFRVHSTEPQVLTLSAKGEEEVTGRNIEPNAEVELVNPDEVLGHLTEKNATLDVELKVERGLGYWPVERHTSEKLPIGAIAIDALFSPVLKVNCTVDDMRVGDRTDYNRLKVEIETDGTITPSSALHKSASILKDHFDKVLALEVKEAEIAPVEAPKKKARKKKAE